MTDMDLGYTNRRLMAALAGIAAGKRLSDSVPVQGHSTKIFEALNDAAKHLIEPFHADDDLETVDHAFNQLGIRRTSDQKNEVAKAILEALIPARRK